MKAGANGHFRSIIMIIMIAISITMITAMTAIKAMLSGANSIVSVEAGDEVGDWALLIGAVVGMGVVEVGEVVVEVMGGFAALLWVAITDTVLEP